MKIDNSCYTVTHPDLMLTPDGVNVCISSTDKQLIKSIQNTFEKYLLSSIVFNVQNTITTDKSLAWLYYISEPADFLIIDLDTCAWIDICLAMKKQEVEGKYILFFNQRNIKPEAVTLINAMGDFYMLTSIDRLDNFIYSEILPRGSY